MDRKLLRTVLDKFAGGPVGVENLAAAIGEERDTIEDVLEPFLIQQGFLQRTSRGRVATALVVPALRADAAGARRRSPTSSRTGAPLERRAPDARRDLSLPAPRLLRGHRRRRRRLLRQLSQVHGARAHRMAGGAGLRARGARARARRRVRRPSRWRSSTGCRRGSATGSTPRSTLDRTRPRADGRIAGGVARRRACSRRRA